MSFLVCGEALWDLFAVFDGPSPHFNACIGGSPFNVAVGLARLDQKVALLTGMSGDPLGKRLHQALEREGVDTSYLIATDRKTTLSLVDVGEDGGPAYNFYGENCADRVLTPENLPDLPDDVLGLHVGSYSLVVEPVGTALQQLTAREAGRRLITLDPNVRLNVEPNVDHWRQRVNDHVRHADVVKVSDEDLAILYPERSIHEVARDWCSRGAALVIVTLGAEGAVAYTKTTHVAVAGRKVEVVDTVGAGDTFMAALISRLTARGLMNRNGVASLGDDALHDLLRYSVDAAAITCARRGADLPRTSDLLS